MLRLNLAQGHFNQTSGVVDFVHGGQGQDLAWGAGMEQDCLLRHGHSADQVFGDLNEDIFERLVGMKRWIRGDFNMTNSDIGLSKPVVEIGND
ncbi:hypothetical protein [Pseudomonas sp. BBP2017]|uniref:hypothetical protein n=1 Tax=Pseudomonas sp. BBP2017 TaxID=2109731 RepID=UPI001304F288